MEYDRHYELQSVLSQEPALVPAPDLYNTDMEILYAAMIDRLAQDLPDGSPSPFSAQNPGTETSILVGTQVYINALIGHEINLIPDRAWVHLNRMMGIEFKQPQYPIIGLIFTVNPQAVSRGLSVEVQMGTEVRSSIDGTLSAITITPAVFSGSQTTITIPARLNRLGFIPQLRPGEFSILPQLLSFIDSVSNPGTTISTGSEYETLPQAMLRARYQLKTQERCVTARDYAFWAKELGAKQVNIIPKLQPNTTGIFNDLITVAIYPTVLADSISPQLEAMSLAATRLLVIPAEIIYVTGEITIKARLGTNDFDLLNLIALQIQNDLNPPNATWGDKSFTKSVINTLIKIDDINSVSFISLIDSITEKPISELQVYPWHLFEVQQSINIKIDRS